MATIHERKTGSGEVVWELTHGTGADRQRFVAGRTRGEALVVLDQFQRQIALHGAAPKDLRVGNAAAEFGDYLKHNRRPKTVSRYMRVVRTFANCFLVNFHPEVETLRDIKPHHVEDFKNKRTEGRIKETKSAEEKRREDELRAALVATPNAASPSDNAKYGWLGRHTLRARVSQRTVNYELRVMFTFFRWCIRKNYLFVNPSTLVERFRLPKRALPKFMTSEDLKRFFAECDERSRRLYMAILLTGMRKGEAEHLTWEDVSLELDIIFIQEKPDLGWRPKTDERIIPISPILHDLLVLQHADRTSDRFVFGNEAGNRDTHMLERLKKICARAGVRNATVHALRHSFGAHLRMAGVSLADIADLLGHRDLATTQIYAKVQQGHLRTAVSRLSPLVAAQAIAEKPPMTPENVTRAKIRKGGNPKLLTE